MEKLGLQCVQLATTFLFHCGLHTKKTFRYSTHDYWRERDNTYMASISHIQHVFRVELCHVSTCTYVCQESIYFHRCNVYVQVKILNITTGYCVQCSYMCMRAFMCALFTVSLLPHSQGSCLRVVWCPAAIPDARPDHPPLVCRHCVPEE